MMPSSDLFDQRSPRGRPAHPESAYLKAFLIRQCEGFMYTSQLHRFLLKHPLLVIELGFHLVLDPTQPYGFDVARTVPSVRWLREQLRSLDPALLQRLLQGLVTALHAEIPGLGETVTFRVKHIGQLILLYLPAGLPYLSLFPTRPIIPTPIPLHPPN